MQATLLVEDDQAAPVGCKEFLQVKSLTRSSLSLSLYLFVSAEVVMSLYTYIYIYT